MTRPVIDYQNEMFEVIGSETNADLVELLSMNAFQDQAFHEAVEATGRKRLIIGALHTEICLAFA
jgi:nicotinamidase-related amidase